MERSSVLKHFSWPYLCLSKEERKICSPKNIFIVLSSSITLDFSFLINSDMALLMHELH